MGGATRFIMLLSTPFPSLLLHRPPSLVFLRRLSSTTTTYTRYLTLSPSIKSFQQNLHTQPLKSHSLNQYSQPTHPWTEWTHFISSLNYLQSSNVLNHELHSEDAFVVYEEKELSDEFLQGAASCLAFARARPELLGLLSRRDIEVIVTNGTPFLFKSALDTARKMRDFLGVDGASVLESEKASTADIMKYILSYASKPMGSSIGNSLFSRELVESSIRNLLGQIAQLSFGNVEQNMHVAERRQSFGGYDQTPGPAGQHVQMKRGDWICPKCSFMNFARNMKCLECEESRPKRQLVGREWECPQCNFFNFGKNMACMRCECKQPGEFVSQSGYSGYNMDKTSMDRKSGENESTRFNEVTQLNNASKLDRPGITSGKSAQINSSASFPLSSPSEHQTTSKSNGRHVPFVPLPADKFSKQNQDLKPDLGKDAGQDSYQSVSFAANHASAPATPSSDSLKPGANAYFSGKPETLPSSEKNDEVRDEEPETWFQRVAELNDVKDLPSSISDDDVPEMMPIRKGENRFVVSKKKDRSLTSPAYKRQVAMEQGKNPDFVPFVPFPPGYFAKKDKEEAPDNMVSSAKPSGETSSGSIVEQTLPERATDLTTRPCNDVQETINRSVRMTPPNGEPSRSASTFRSMKDEINVNRFSTETNTSQSMDVPRGSEHMSENQNIRSVGIGKSLEGSAVKETDPLDMSEEAKAERWFRRVAQIKDISELSQIPDEDFPSIMPMRKGVNRFVVSKRKTPLERRLTSPQYRRNLPSVPSDPVKKDGDNA